MINTKEKLEQIMSEVGISGNWINADQYGFSRTYLFNVNGQDIVIEWYCNYSNVNIGNVRLWVDSIQADDCYPEHGKWIEMMYQGRTVAHIKVGEEE